MKKSNYSNRPSGLKKFLIKTDPFEFNGKQTTSQIEVLARDCHEACFRFKSSSKENYATGISGVKPFGAIKWRRDPSLISTISILKAAVGRGLIPGPRMG
jgi:hypothetical protein